MAIKDPSAIGEPTTNDANGHVDTQTTNGDGQYAVGGRCKLRVWQERFKADGTPEKVTVESLTPVQTFDSDYALVVRQHFTPRNQHEKTQLTVNSPHILHAFRSVIGAYPALPVDFSEPFDTEKFHMLLHFWDLLEDYRRSVHDTEAADHLALLFEFMQAELGHEKKRLDSQVASGSIDFESLWSIYRPGSLVITLVKGWPWLLRLEKTAYENGCQQEGRFLEVHCTYTDYDGTDLGVAKHKFKVHQRSYFAADNPAKITDLPVFPRSLYTQSTNLEERLAQRGDYFISLQGVCTRQYRGVADHIKDPPSVFFHPDMESFEPVWLSYAESGRVIIDRKTFREEHAKSQKAIKSDVESLEKMLCPPFVYGYSVSRKEWCRFYIEHISSADWQPDPFDGLILPDSQKRLLRALVSSHTFPENPRDQAQQKGRGLVTLLHGPPGSGKTLTAECAAEMTHRALISTSMAELNKENMAWYFELHLKKILQYATIWKAVILLDEADVFLEARTDDSASAAERNAVVAVFLKHLEYFSGIVFLTTNRIHVFDAAMKSRVHLALGYEAPSTASRQRIWNQYILRVPISDRDIDSENEVPKLAEEELNGREISNAITTACTLARYEKTPLRLEHVESVLEVRRQFTANLERTKTVKLGERK